MLAITGFDAVGTSSQPLPTLPTGRDGLAAFALLTADPYRDKGWLSWHRLAHLANHLKPLTDKALRAAVGKLAREITTKKRTALVPGRRGVLERWPPENGSLLLTDLGHALRDPTAQPPAAAPTHTALSGRLGDG